MADFCDVSLLFKTESCFVFYFRELSRSLVNNQRKQLKGKRDTDALTGPANLRLKGM